jgi:hypothetical protein
MRNFAGSASFSGSFSGSAPVFAGLPWAKNSTLIAIANPAWRTTTNISKILLVFLSVALKTGYKFRNKKATLRPNPTPTKSQLRSVNGDHEIRATGIQMRFE